MRNNTGTKLWGVFLILIGAGIAGQAFGFWDFNLLFDGWWTLFIIIPCLISIVQNGFNAMNAVGVLIGGVMLLSEQGFIRWALVGKMIFPAILVAVGVTILLRGNAIGERKTSYADIQNGLVNYTVFFGGRDIRLPKEEFKGASITAIFGGVNLDLTDAIIAKDAVIQVTTVFGGVDIRVPYHVTVKEKSTPIFGGVSNKRHYQAVENAPALLVDALCIFGGVDIK